MRLGRIASRMRIEASGYAGGPAEHDGGKPTLSIGVNQGYWSKTENKWVDQGTVWLRITPRTPKAQKELDYARRGSIVHVTGELTIRTYERRDGGKGISYDVYADTVSYGHAQTNEPTMKGLSSC